MSIKELEAKAKESKSLMALIEEAEQEAEAIKDEIKKVMGENEEMRAGDYKLTYKKINSTRFDSKSFKADMPDIAKRYTITTEYRRFAIA